MELLKSVTRPTEFWALLKFQYGGGKNHIMPRIDQGTLSTEMKRCLELLNQTSRSFSAVIQALDNELRPAVCIFYLVLRALDTVEDDMTIPVPEKKTMLKEFHTHLYQKDWQFMESKEKDKVVLEEFPVVRKSSLVLLLLASLVVEIEKSAHIVGEDEVKLISAEFQRLKPGFQEVIADITKRMGEGMTVFLEDEVETLAQWDEYCHYVAGLVGIGLSRLFSVSGLESEVVGQDQALSNSMGLFLQKTNIIRDYLEDVQSGRKFWPKEAWSKYVGNLKDFTQSGNINRAVACLNSLITNALKHVPDVLKYMSRIKNQSVFNFCAIPQTMAIATLASCFNNPAVFSSVVKIRRGQAVDIMMRSTTMLSFKSVFSQYIGQICSILIGDPNIPDSLVMWELVADIRAQCEEGLIYNLDSMTASVLDSRTVQVGMVSAVAMVIAYWTGYI